MVAGGCRWLKLPSAPEGRARGDHWSRTKSRWRSEGDKGRQGGGHARLRLNGCKGFWSRTILPFENIKKARDEGERGWAEAGAIR